VVRLFYTSLLIRNPEILIEFLTQEGFFYLLLRHVVMASVDSMLE